MLILASRSPRRREILTTAGIPHIVQAADVPEQIQPGEAPEDYVLRLSTAKAEAIEGQLVLGADTVVVFEHHILEKPETEEDARRMLRLLSGREHEVLTGICLKRNGQYQAIVCRTRVRFAELSDTEIHEYVASGEPMDKAGAYAVQGLASKFIERIEGDFYNVVGLPVSVVYRMLKS